MVLLHSSARGTSFHPVVLTYLLAGAQSGQLLLRLGDLDAIKDDDLNDYDQNGDDQNGDDHHNHHQTTKSTVCSAAPPKGDLDASPLF